MISHQEIEGLLIIGESSIVNLALSLLEGMLVISSSYCPLKTPTKSSSNGSPCPTDHVQVLSGLLLAWEPPLIWFGFVLLRCSSPVEVQVNEDDSSSLVNSYGD